MDPQHLARIDDDGSMRRWRGGTAGGGSASRSSSTAPDVAVLAPVVPRAESADLHVRRHELVLAGAPATPSPAIPAPRDSSGSGAWPLPAELELLDLAEDWPLAPDAGLLGAGSVDFSGNTVADLGDGPASSGPAADPFAPEQVVAALAAARRGRHRRPPTHHRRPALYVAAALIGAAGVAGIAAADIGTTQTETAAAGQPVSVAEELGLLQADPQTLTSDQAAVRLQEMVASRAEREDAQAAAAQVQADADRAAQEAAAEAARHRAAMPVHGARISSGFGYRWGTLHAGVDFAAPLGTPEYAVADGVVVKAGAASGYGLVVYIQHENGDVTVYGHMQEILVEEGQTVKAGEEIAKLGNRGQSTGPHLHFEVIVGGIDGEKIDPLPWLRERGVEM
ncbi:M23 family metallopeptidase [Modestobacter sp. I12A-02662]|uniref:M23 family metallopeptidase n=1 Tax=Modestobacter sp. I12A-02662 TaxID=1730496 RepID=UPI0034DE7D3A